MSARVVFYSWQSDLPNSTNRGLIRAALEKACSSKTEQYVAEEPDRPDDHQLILDSDTRGAAGSPDIAATILQKIQDADVFVADVSIVGEVATPSGPRATPNPNVLVEVGFALHALGSERVVLVANTAFGELERLPFDMRGRRVLQYRSAARESDRATPRKALEAQLRAAVWAAVQTVKPRERIFLRPTVHYASLDDPTPVAVTIRVANGSSEALHVERVCLKREHGGAMSIDGEGERVGPNDSRDYRFDLRGKSNPEHFSSAWVEDRIGRVFRTEFRELMRADS
ncbi:MAG TPA: hypothetical protein VG937_00925 [Polyangiaceae bacterium]|nr:hypothetical protein [Polyangiaceae bacterium]